MFSSNGNIKYVSGSGTTLTTNGTVSNCLDNQWHMVTVTYDGTILMIYVDGALFDSKASNSMAWGSSVTVSYFGTDDGYGGAWGYFTGKLDNFRSYNRALTASEIQGRFFYGSFPVVSIRALIKKNFHPASTD